MTKQVINQKKAVKLLRKGKSLDGLEIRFDDEKIEALDAFLLRKNGIALPDSLVFYDDGIIDFSDDPEMRDDDFLEKKLIPTVRVDLAVEPEVADWVSQNKIAVDVLLADLLKEHYQKRALAAA